jgi:hypothetical protein
LANKLDDLLDLLLVNYIPAPFVYKHAGHGLARPPVAFPVDDRAMVRTTLAALAVFGASFAGASNLGQRWLSSWATMPQLTEPANLPPPPFNATGRVFANATVRQSFKVSLPGSQFRLRFSNVFSDVNLDLTAVTVALPGNHSAVGTSDIDTKTLHTVTFSGTKGFSIPNGAQVVSDPIQWPVAENAIITVSTYLAAGQASPSNSITSHPGSRTNSYFDFGDLTAAKNISSPTAQTIAHWYFLSGLEVLSTNPTSYAVAIVGDSITDGRGSTTNGNDRQASTSPSLHFRHSSRSQLARPILQPPPCPTVQ